MQPVLEVLQVWLELERPLLDGHFAYVADSVRQTHAAENVVHLSSVLCQHRHLAQMILVTRAAVQYLGSRSGHKRINLVEAKVAVRIVQSHNLLKLLFRPENVACLEVARSDAIQVLDVDASAEARQH